MAPRRPVRYRPIAVTRRAAGFTLIEVVVALIVLATGILGLLKFQGTLISTSGLSREYSEAVMLGERKIEELRGYQALASAASVFAYADIATGSDTVAGKSATFQRTWTVTTSTAPDHKQINLTVSWADNRGGNQSIVLTSTIGKSSPIASAGLITSAAPLGGGGLPPRP